MYFINNDPGASHKFLTTLAFMHRYHHVRVNVLQGLHLKSAASRRKYASDRHAAPGVHWADCTKACESSRGDGVAHSKFITISKLRGTRRPAVFTTSANVTHQQLLLTVESGVLFTRNTGLYKRFVHEFNIDHSCAEHHRCNRKLRTRNWQSFGSERVYFTPNVIDPIANDLKKVSCRRGGTISVASLWLTGGKLTKVLNQMRKQGCRVRVVIEHDDRPRGQLKAWHARVMLEHDKYLIVNTPTQHHVYFGTQDFGYKALHVNDNYMVRTNYGPTFRAYQREFAWQWGRAKAVTSPKAKIVARQAATLARTDHRA